MHKLAKFSDWHIKTKIGFESQHAAKYVFCCSSWEGLISSCEIHWSVSLLHQLEQALFPQLLTGSSIWAPEPPHSTLISLDFLSNPLAEESAHVWTLYPRCSVWKNELQVLDWSPACHKARQALFNLAQFLLASGIFLLSMSHQLDPVPLCTTLSLSGQPHFNQSNGQFVLSILQL